MTKPFIIAIDGKAASGKGTLASSLAEHYGFDYMDTGLLYRAIGVICDADGGDPDIEQDAFDAALKMIETYPESMNGLALKSDKAGPLASKAAQHPSVRSVIVQLQVDFGEKANKGAVLDGRDITTFIFPNADVKFFVTADVEVRAKRRHTEVVQAQPETSYQDILDDMIARDARDAGRAVAPMKIADDAHVIDNTNMGIEAVFDYAFSIVDPLFQKQ